MSDLRYTVAKGLSWSFVAQLGHQALKILIEVFLVRLLTPDDFGLFAMVVAITGFAKLIAECGIGYSLIHNKNCTENYLSSAFWFNFGTSLVFAIATVAGAPIIAAFYHEPSLIPFTRVLALDFVISGTFIVPQALLTKSLQFRILAIIEIVSILISGLIGVVVAWAGGGVWSLVIQTLSLSITAGLLMHILSGWHPQLYFSFEHLKELLRFGMNLLGAQILNYWTQNSAQLLIGYVFGSGDLGIYNRAYTLLMVPLTYVSLAVSKVIFPSFSLIAEEKSRIREAFLKVLKSVSFMLFPLMMGLFVVADTLILVVFGQQWVPMIPIIRVFCVVGVIQSVAKLDGNLYYSMGRPDLQFKVGLVLKPLEILGIILGLRWGILGVAIGYGIGLSVGFYPNFVIAGKLIELKFSSVLKSVSGAFFCSVAMALSVWGIGQMIPSDWPLWFTLAIKVLSGILVYWAGARVGELAAYKDIVDIIVKLLSQRSKILHE